MKAKPLNSSVVTRVRIGWLVISLLLIAVLAASVVGLRDVQETQQGLSQKAIPALERFEQVSGELTKVQSAINSLKVASKLKSHQAAYSDASASLERLTILLPEKAEIQDVLGSIKKSMDKLDRLGKAELANRDKVDKVFNQIVTTGEKLSESLLRQAVDDGISLEAMILSGVNAEMEAEVLIPRVSELNTLTQLGSAMNTVIDKTEATSSAQSQIELSELEERLAFSFRGAVRNLVHLPSSGFREELATSVGRLREDVLSENGLVALQYKRLEIATGLGSALAKLATSFEEISTFVNIGVADAKKGIGEAAKLIDAKVTNTISSLIVLGAAIILTVGLATIFLIERNIIQRLKILTRSVREIASGENDWHVGIDGGDEFGEMASALEVFKGNSKELRRSNEELGRFAYAASHDLRSPLRAIHDLAKWTIEDAGDVLPDDCQTNLEMLLDRADRLSSLLDGLLDYSKVGRAERNVATVDLERLPHEVLELLGKDDRFDLIVEGDSKKIATYEAPLVQVFQNFIGNAVKHHDLDEGRITVTYRISNDRLSVSVSDDGPGIPPEYHEKIFQLFQTLKSRDVVEGSGIGLAIIRKQVEQFGGVLSVKSDPSEERGTTFTFDWPLVDAQNVLKIAA